MTMEIMAVLTSVKFQVLCFEASVLSLDLGKNDISTFGESLGFRQGKCWDSPLVMTRFEWKQCRFYLALLNVGSCFGKSAASYNACEGMWPRSNGP